MRASTYTDFVLALLLSALFHYSVVTIIPAAKARLGPARVSEVELELVAPRTPEERSAPVPAIALPSVQPVPASPVPVPATAAPATAAPATAAPEVAHREPQKLPDDFTQSVDLDNPRHEKAPEHPHF